MVNTQQKSSEIWPELSPAERHWKIMETLRKHGTVNVSNLSEDFRVSLSTIRRDLERLEEEGFLTRTYGGAYLRETLIRERSLTERLTTQAQAKEAIAIVAAGMIKEGETIIVGSGTTCLRLAHNFPMDISCTVVTNDIRLAAELCSRPKVDIINTGGQLYKDGGVAYGPIAEHTLSRINADKAIFSVMGFSLEHGLTHAMLEIASFKRRVIRSARQLILIIDSQKIGKVYTHLIAPPDQLDVIITEDVPPGFVDKVGTFGVELILAKTSQQE
jgi:DeoR/GlpR family transcriptional regulator of sugar metabolism